MVLPARLAETDGRCRLNGRAGQNPDRAQLIKRLRRSIQNLLENKRRVPIHRELEESRKPGMMSLFPVLSYRTDTVYSNRSDSLCLTVRADDLREWMVKN
jgi:hypothetical protein